MIGMEINSHGFKALCTVSIKEIFVGHAKEGVRAFWGENST